MGPTNINLLIPFWSSFGPKMVSKAEPKIGPKIANFGVHFWIPFFEALGLFGCLLGALLGLLRLSWEAFGLQKPEKTYFF